jgi:hypothetical protein
MPTTKQKYVLSQRHQLIDLNKTYKNFKLQFQVVSTESNKDFHAIVLNQEQLDGTTDLQNVEMKLAKGRIGGTIVADNDKYQNYFLVLKSILPQDNTEVEVTTNIEEVEPKAPVEEPPVPPPEEPATTTEGYAGSSETATGVTQAKTTRPLFQKPWFWLVLFVLVAGGAYYYYFYIYKKNAVVTLSSGTATPSAMTTAMAPPLPMMQSSCAETMGSLGAEVVSSVIETTSDIVADMADAVGSGVGTVPVVAMTTGRGAKKATSSKQNLYNKLSEIA